MLLLTARKVNSLETNYMQCSVWLSAVWRSLLHSLSQLLQFSQASSGGCHRTNVVVPWKFLLLRRLTGVPLMYHRSLAAGFDLGDVQLTITLSPMWYDFNPPDMRGPCPCFGKTLIKKPLKFIKCWCWFSLIRILHLRLTNYSHFTASGDSVE